VDLTHVLRRLIRFPVFTVVVVLTLAIGIGANSAIFAVVYGILLKPLPYAQPDSLIAAHHTAPGLNVRDAGSAPFLYFTYREQSKSLQSVGLWRGDRVSVTGLAEPEEVPVIDVTDGVLPMLGVTPALGRLFTHDDDTPASAETVVLSYGYWKSRFGGDPAAVGRRVLFDGRPREIIGVLPASFRFMDREAAAVLPLRLDRSKVMLGNFSYSSVARLAPGVTIESATVEARRLVSVAIEKFPPFPGFSQELFLSARLAPLFLPLRNSLVGDIGRMLWILLGTIGVLLLIACANVANLLLVRTDGRQQELAIRAALGAGWGRIARELMTESLVLGALGGIVGLGLAYAGLRVIAATAPAGLPRISEVGLNGVVVLFDVAISLLAGAVFGAFPMLKYARPRVVEALRSRSRTMSDSRERHRARNTLVVAQVALALVLLIGSGLMIRTFQALRHVQPGFARPDELLTLRIAIPAAAVKDGASVLRMQQSITEKIAAISGVSSVGMTTVIPMDGNSWSDPIFAEDKDFSTGAIPRLRRFKFISPGLVRTMGNTVLSGRDFTWEDIINRRPVALVSDNLARELWGSPAAAIGKRIRETLKSPYREIVGVVSDEREDGFDQQAPSFVCWPLLMENFEGNTDFVTRAPAFIIRSSRVGSSGFVNAVSEAVWSVNPNLPLAGVRTLQEITDKSLARTSFTLVMLSIAGVMALLVGMAGLYGVISYAVAQRTREIGIRVALGAERRQVTGMFVGMGLGLTAIGIVIGLAGAVALTRLLASLLFNVSPVDPITFAGASIGLVGAAALASYLPALRAATLNPVDALRAD